MGNVREPIEQARLVFTGSRLERNAQVRGDSEALACLAGAPEARVLLLWRGKPLMETAYGGGVTGLSWLAPSHPLCAAGGEALLYLGHDSEAPDSPLFALDFSDWVPEPGGQSGEASFVDRSEVGHPALSRRQVFADLRANMMALPRHESEFAATARGLLEWHRSHMFCAKCGAPSEVAQAGWIRVCPSCSAQHFPRTDPVVIMLVLRGNDVLVGRSPGWPEGMYSLLAGFMEPGEMMEDAVRREVLEESGVRVGAVSYLACQPWPFPASLMIGCRAQALSEEITLDPVELEDALWVSRERMAAVFRGEDEALRPARPGSMAHYLLHNWLADGLDELLEAR